MYINGDIVRSLRERKVWTQERLATLSGVSVKSIQRVENNFKCNQETFSSLSAVLGVDASLLSKTPENIDSQSNNTEASLLKGQVGVMTQITDSDLFFDTIMRSDNVSMKCDSGNDMDQEMAIHEAAFYLIGHADACHKLNKRLSRPHINSNASIAHRKGELAKYLNALAKHNLLLFAGTFDASVLDGMSDRDEKVTLFVITPNNNSNIAEVSEY